MMPSCHTAIASLVTDAAIAIDNALRLLILGGCGDAFLSEQRQQKRCKCIEAWLFCMRLKCNLSHQVPMLRNI